MNRIILTKSENTASNTFEITDSKKLEHLKNVLKVSEGDILKACELNNGLGQALVKKITETIVTLIYTELERGLESKTHLIMGASRPPTCKKILEHGSSMGLASINFFNAILSEKSYLDSKLFKNESYREFTKLGISQSAVFFKEPTVSINKDLPVHLIQERHQKFILSLNTEKTFTSYKINKNLPISLAIGPERGWVEDEESCFEQLGFAPVKISNSVLRVEQATFAALAQIELIHLSS